MRFSLRRCIMALLVSGFTLLFVTDFLQSWHRLQQNAELRQRVHRRETYNSDGDTDRQTPVPFLQTIIRSVIKRLGKSEPEKTPHVWPSPDETDDRILAQLQYIPPTYNANSSRFKTILVMTGLNGMREGRWRFIKDKCLVDRCLLTTDQRTAQKADAVLWQNDIFMPTFPKLAHHIWVYFQLESPFHSAVLSRFHGKINWTSNYRSDSTLVAPYEKFMPFKNASQVYSRPMKNYAEGKTKHVAWFVSNCNAKNNRYEYAVELGQHINVDIYGACGQYSCSRAQTQECWDMLSKDYKFYLSFENSNCKGYITEKFFWNGLRNNVIPIVMGASREEYRRVAPPNSYIHVDDFESPRHLADYLHKLDKNDDLYSEYFRWKGTGTPVDTKYFCRLCAMLHDETKVTWYDDIAAWWKGPGVCQNYPQLQGRQRPQFTPPDQVLLQNVFTELEGKNS